MPNKPTCRTNPHAEQIPMPNKTSEALFAKQKCFFRNPHAEQPFAPENESPLFSNVIYTRQTLGRNLRLPNKHYNMQYFLIQIAFTATISKNIEDMTCTKYQS